MARDPLVRTRKYLESVGRWDQSLQETLQQRAHVIAHEVAEAAMNIEKPEADDLFRYTFESLPDELVRQMQTMRTDSIGQNPQQVGLKSRAPQHEHAHH